MIRSSMVLKSMTVFFLLEMVVSIILPTFSWALTAGPSAPEFSSFEPVDTTDMVNLTSGEFIYNMPLLEVPGPGGGYPMSLSYHSGIMPDQEASWVGLGFTLNPGAINRTVSGFADDYVEARRQVKDYWDGGSSTTKSYIFGLNTPVKGLTANLTISRTHDTYKGFSTNATAGLGFNPIVGVLQSFKSGLTGNGKRIGDSDYTGQMRDKVFDEGMGSLASGTSMDVSISSKSGFHSSASLGGSSLISPGGSPGALSSFTNVNDRGTVPLPFNIGYLTLKDSYTRYWSDQTDALFAFGSLYSSKNNQTDHYSNSIESNYSEFMSYSNDIYNVYDKSTAAASDIKDEADPAKQIGGSLPSYDQYYVTGQGIGGVIEPVIFDNGDMRGQNLYYRDPTFGFPFTTGHTLKYNSLKPFTATKKVDFRFKNDFSNSLTVTPSTIADNSGVLSVGAQTVTADPVGFDSSATRQKLEGSKHIDWYTNQEIANGSAKSEGFIDCYAQPSDRVMSMDIYDNYLQPEAFAPSDQRNFRGKPSGLYKTDRYKDHDLYADFVTGHIESMIRFQSLKPKTVSLADRIGGFKITNASGVTYHYALPVYNYNEYTRSKMKKPHKGAATVTEIKNDEPYAYTWLLTAVTGPDYVDRSDTGDLANGKLDDADQGYWVKFDYGKWTDSYQWRTPHTGYVTDSESEYATFSYGIKELYYLDAIETQTHKAIFIKSKRRDGRGVTSRLEGGSNPRIFRMHYKMLSNIGNIEYYVAPVSTLKLDAIYLFDKKDLASIPLTKATGSKYIDSPITNPTSFPYQGSDYVYQIPNSSPVKYVTIKQGEDFVKTKYHNGQLVYDDGDLEQLSPEMLANFKSGASQTIELKTNYSLAPGVENSIGFFTDIAPNVACRQFPFPDQPYSCDIPAYNMDFEWPMDGCIDPLLGTPECCNTTMRSWFYNTTFCNNAYGDYFGNEVQFYKTGKLTLTEVKTLGHGGIGLIPPVTFAYKKNPQYDRNKYDDWGFYKADYSWGVYAGPDGPGIEELSRKITPASAAQTDAWSLSSIKSPLGTKVSINYEPNTYSQSVYNDDNIFGIEKIETVGQTDVKIYLKEKNLNLANYFTVGGTVGLKAMIVSRVNAILSTYPSSPDIYNTLSNSIVALGDDFLTVSAPALNQFLKPGRVKNILGINFKLTPYFIAGAVITPETSVNRYAGGIRVKELTVDEFGGHKSIVQYSYNKPGTTVSSGITSYKPYNPVEVHYPTKIDFFSGAFNGQGNYNAPDPDEADKKKLVEYKTEFQKVINQMYESQLVFGREAPAPGAMYEYVTVKNKTDNLYHSAYTVHRFKVFDPSMVTVQTNDYGTAEKQRRNVTLKNIASDVGSPISESRYSTVDNILLYQKKYGYLYGDEDKDFETPIRNTRQGIIEQAFHKHVTLTDWHWRGYGVSPIAEPTGSVDKSVVTKKEEQTNVLTGIEEKDFKTGGSTISELRGFDFLTGSALKTLTTDQYGNRYMAESAPAYSLKSGSTTVYPGMGIKLFNSANKSMISQNAATYSYRLGAGDVRTSLVSAAVQTWSKIIPVLHPSGIGFSTDPRQEEIWRKQSEYQWKGDDMAPDPYGYYPMANFQPFNFLTPGSSAAQWQKSNEIKLYGIFSHELTATDLNGMSGAVRLSADNTKVFAVVANAKYNEFACSGAEDVLPTSGGTDWVVQRGGSATVVSRANETDFVTTHTGTNALQVTAVGQQAFSYSFTTEPASAYHASVWVNSNAGRLYYRINGGAPQPGPAPAESKKAGNWYLIACDIPQIASSSTLEVWCESTGATCNFDDFRVHPMDAAMTSYVYNRWGEVSHILNNNNLFVEYVYDAVGRLKETRAETFNHEVVKTGEVIYHYAGN
jgi:hypothetical protein